MKTEIERRKPDGLLDHVSLAVTTCGVGYLPLMPGTFGSAVGVAVYLVFTYLTGCLPVWAGLTVHHGGPLPLEDLSQFSPGLVAWIHSVVLVSFLLFCLLGTWAAGRSTELLGNTDPPEAVVDEVIGQLITFLFVPFGISWPFILAGFLLFRLFDIWKPYPIDSLQVLPGGIGVCADDILAGVYAGICLSVIYAVSLSI